MHETAKGLTDAGVMDMQTMHEFDALCLPEIECYDAAHINDAADMFINMTSRNL